MSLTHERLLAAIAPVLWGTTYVTTTELLPAGYPIHAALLRALPAGVLLLLVARRLPAGQWWWRAPVLGALNFSVFWICLFVAAYRLPGGVAATVGSVQPILVLGLAALVLEERLTAQALVAAAAGLVGVALLVLSPEARLDPIGIGAALVGAASMAAGTVLTRKWAPDVPLVTLTAWQLTAGGLLLLPVAWFFEPPLPWPTPRHLLGFAHLGLVGAALAYTLWFRGIARLGASAVSLLGLLSPLTAVTLGWLLLGETLRPAQLAGAALVLGSIQLGRPRPDGSPPSLVRPEGALG